MDNNENKINGEEVSETEKVTKEAEGETAPETAPEMASETAAAPVKKKRSVKKIILISVAAVLGVIVLVVAAAGIYLYNKLDLIDFETGDVSREVTGGSADQLETDEPYNPDESYETVAFDSNFFDDVTTEDESETSEDVTDGTEDTTEEEETDPSVTTGVTRVSPNSIVWPDIESLGDDGLINIMLIGQDNSSYKTRSRSDTMMLISINPNTGEMVMVSFLRDTYVQIGNGYKDNRLNVAYKLGGFPLLSEVMYNNFGVTVDYGVAVNFDAFKKIVDILGGVNIELSENEATYLKECDWGDTGHADNVKAGVNVLDGELALAYVRARHVKGSASDWGRTARQRKFITSVYKSLIGSSLGQINTLLNEVLPMVTVYGMDKNELISLVATLFPLLGNEIKGYSVPSTGYYKSANVSGASVLIPNLTKIRARLLKILPIDESAKKETTAASTTAASTTAAETTAAETTSAPATTETDPPETTTEETTQIPETTAPATTAEETTASLTTEETTVPETTAAQ